MDLAAIRRHKSIDVCVGILQETMNFGEMAFAINNWLRSYLDTIVDMASSDFVSLICSVIESDAWQTLPAKATPPTK